MCGLLRRAGGWYGDPRSLDQPDGLEMAGDEPILGAQVHVHVGLLRGEDAAMLPRIEANQLDRHVGEEPPHLCLLVSLRVVRKIVTLVEDVERGLHRRAAN